MSITQYNTINIGQCFAVAFEYGDTSGLNDDDIEHFNTYLFDHIKDNTCFEYGEETNFLRCDITGLMADCIEVKLFA